MNSKKLISRKPLVVAVASGLALGFSGASFASDEVISSELQEQLVSQIITDQGANAAPGEASNSLVAIRAEEDGDEGADDDVDEEVVVTGSRIRNAPKTAPVVVLDREYIEKRGFSSVEDIINSLPQNRGSSNAANTAQQPVGGDGSASGTNAQGEFAANLRGLGQSATLVLINGRRTAGSTAFSGAVVNLANIPAASIERIEVLTDSAAAVYGSDAIAGVINVITRKDYAGATTTVRYEDGLNGGSVAQISQLLGFNWDGGNLSATLSASENKPISSLKTGYTTQDYRSRGGPHAVDGRNFGSGQPGFTTNLFTDAVGSLAADDDGLQGNSPDPANLEDTRADVIPLNQSPLTKNKQADITINHEFSDTVTAFSTVRYSNVETERLTIPPTIIGVVSPFHPTNNTGAPLFVFYQAITELAARPDLFGNNNINEQESWHFEAGATVELPFRDWRADVVGFYATAKNTVSSLDFPFFLPDGFLDQHGVNILGNGSAQDLTEFEGLLTSPQSNGSRKNTSSGFSVIGNGSLMDMAHGDLGASFGIEYRTEEIDQSGDPLAAEGIPEIGQAAGLSEPKPSQDIFSASAEVALPLADTWTVSLQGRYDKYDVDAPGDPSVDGKSYSEFSPRISTSWEATDSLTVRGSWGESFKAPNLTNLVVPNVVGRAFAQPLFDPQDTSIPATPLFPFSGQVGNPGLRPETGVTYTIGVDWAPDFLEGFTASLTYNDIEFSDQIRSSIPLGAQEVLDNESLFPLAVTRDPDTGMVTHVRTHAVNVALSTQQALDFNFRYQWSTDWGEFDTSLGGVYNLSQKQSEALDESELEEVVATTVVDRWRANLALGWSTENYGANLFGNYIGSYTNTLPISITSFNAFLNVLDGLDRPVLTEGARISHRITWDLTGYYQMDNGVKFTAGARNVLNTRIPFHYGVTGPFDLSRVDLRGRILFAEVQKTFDF